MCLENPGRTFIETGVITRNGFGDHNKEFWLGNEQIHQLTKYGETMLRVELEAWDGRTAWAEYDTFRSDFIKMNFNKLNIVTTNIQG